MLNNSKKNIFIKLTFLFLVSILTTFIIYNCSVNPVTGKKELSLMSDSTAKRIGEEYFPVYTQVQDGECQDSQLQEYVKRVGQRIARKTHRLDLNYEFNVVNSSIPNAYALPGGKISITRGLLSRLKNEDQLAGILGHELGHVNAKHTANRYTKTILTQAVLAGVGTYLKNKNVKNSNLYMTAGAFGTSLLLLKYSRDDERQADDLGMAYMINSGYNPKAFVETMQIIDSLHKKKPSKWQALLSTHPLTMERIQTAQTKVTTAYQQYSSKPYKTDDFNLALATIKNNEEAYKKFDSGAALLQKKNYKKAKNAFVEAINLYDKEYLFYTYLAQTELILNNNQSAKQNSTKAVQLYPNFFAARLAKGMAESETNNYRESIKDLTKANSLIKDNPTTIFYLAKSYDGVGNVPKAVELYQKTLKITTNKEYVQYAQNRLKVLAPPQQAPANQNRMYIR